MKITITRTTDSEDLERHRLKIEQSAKAPIKIYINPLCECPEDAIIGRDLISGDDIINFIELGYNAAKNGEEIEIIEKNEEN